MNLPFTEEQLLQCHLQRGFKSIGYHFYITKEFMERKSIDIYVPDVGVEYPSTLNLDKGIAFRVYQRNRRGIEILNAALAAELTVFFRDKPKRVSRLFIGDIGTIAKQYTDLLIKESSLAPTTIDSHLLYISSFCEFAHTAGKSLSTLQWEDIISYIDSTRKNKYAKCYPVKLFMRHLYEYHFIPADLSLVFEGVTQRTRNVPLISYFDKNETLKLEESIDRTSLIGKRNYAMILLATRLGLRRSDVVNLQFSDLDWDNNQIAIIQQKTRKQIILPLLGVVDKAMVDYIANGRPKNKSKFIFLGYCKQGVNIIYIRDLLGHVSVTTTEIYAKADSNAKREALEKAYKDIGITVPEVNSWERDPKLKAFLKSLN